MAFIISTWGGPFILLKKKGEGYGASGEYLKNTAPSGEKNAMLKKLFRLSRGRYYGGEGRSPSDQRALSATREGKKSLRSKESRLSLQC